MGTCLRPSWTAMVCPTMSGVTVERRDQVLMTLRSPDAFMVWTFDARWSSTNGPFLRLRGMLATSSSSPSRPAATAAADDLLVGGLALAAGAALGLAPG